MDPLAQPLALPCGVVLRNRIAKAAMTEGLADAHDQATERLATLYRRWSLGGAALHITGNVMVDRRYLERPGNVVIDDNGGHDALRAWSAAGTSGGNELWMQINHPGRQCTRMSSSHPVSASSEKLRGMMGLIARPRISFDPCCPTSSMRCRRPSTSFVWGRGFSTVRARCGRCERSTVRPRSLGSTDKSSRSVRAASPIDRLGCGRR